MTFDIKILQMKEITRYRDKESQSKRVFNELLICKIVSRSDDELNVGNRPVRLHHKRSLLGFLKEEAMTVKHNSKNIVNDAIIKDIATAVESLDYGTVTIKVYDSKIVQTEITAKHRFDDVWHIEGGGI